MKTRRSSGRKGTNTRGQYAVFLSHSSRDTWLAEVIEKRIRAKKIKVWLDEMSLTGGEEILAAVRRGIQNSNELIILASPSSIKSQWVSTEVGIAQGLSKRVTPLLNNIEPDDLGPAKGIKAYELNQFEKLLTELKRRAVRHGT